MQSKRVRSVEKDKRDELAMNKRRAVSIVIPGGNLDDYPEFLDELIKKRNGVFEDTNLEHISRWRFTYHAELDTRESSRTGAILNYQDEKLPSVECVTLVPKKWQDEQDELKKTVCVPPLTEYASAEYAAAPSRVNAVYNELKLKSQHVSQNSFIKIDKY
jgi:hypothetical protein